MCAERSGPSVLHYLSSRSKKCYCPKVRRVGSKGAVLVAVWTQLVCLSFMCLSRLGQLAHSHIAYISTTQRSYAGISVMILLGPLAGLVASAYFERFKSLYASLWLMWSGAIAITFILVLYKVLPNSEALQTVAFSGVVIAEMVCLAAFTAFFDNAVPFGLDQMPDASGEQICAFIHWQVWTMFGGLPTSAVVSTIHHCLDISLSTTHLFQSLVAALLLTVTLSSVFLLRRWLIVEPQGTNPLKTVYKVLRFAARHKTPVRRSAFTYWEAGIPSRIDLGKSKYGGPFTNEEVEDVKTCLRMVLVISCTIATMAFVTVNMYGSSHALQSLFKHSEQPCNNYKIQLILFFALNVIFSLPVYDTIVLPVIKRCMSNTLRRAGMAQALTVCATSIMLVVSIIWYAHNPHTGCVLTSEDSIAWLTEEYKWIVATTELILYASVFFFFTAMLEFVCAQAPYNLRGLLVGLVLSVLLLSILLGIMICLIWKIGYQHNEASSCSVWFYLFSTIAAALGCVVWCAVAKRYKRRERDEPDMCRIFAENYYDH